MVSCLQPTFEKAWRTVQISAALQPSDTLEYLRSTEFLSERRDEQSNVEDEIAATSSALSVLKQADDTVAPGSRVSPPSEHQLAAAAARLEKALAT